MKRKVGPARVHGRGPEHDASAPVADGPLDKEWRPVVETSDDLRAFGCWCEGAIPRHADIREVAHAGRAECLEQRIAVINGGPARAVAAFNDSTDRRRQAGTERRGPARGG